MMNALSLKDAVIVGCSAALVGLIVLLDYITRRHAKERIALDPSHKRLMSGEGENEMESASYKDEAP